MNLVNQWLNTTPNLVQPPHIVTVNANLLFRITSFRLNEMQLIDLQCT
ncbi:hypothetical protein AD25_3791 [Escherichia coli 2-052-05_S4_C3]|nr:hypothetical protein AD25_3791 [Escherichia coli 2-052-05_S4_C3]